MMTKNMTKRVTKKMQTKCAFYLMRKRAQLPAKRTLYVMWSKGANAGKMRLLFDDGKRVQMQANAPLCLVTGEKVQMQANAPFI